MKVELASVMCFLSTMKGCSGLLMGIVSVSVLDSLLYQWTLARLAPISVRLCLVS